MTMPTKTHLSGNPTNAQFNNAIGVLYDTVGDHDTRLGTTTATEIGYLHGVTSGIQGQLNGHSHSWGALTGKPNTLASAGITDGALQSVSYDYLATQIGTEETGLGVEIKGRTLVNLLGLLGRTATSATIAVTSTNYYVVTNSTGASVTVNGTPQVSGYKVTGRTSLALSWVSGYVAVYQITAGEYSGSLLYPYNYVDSVQHKSNTIVTVKTADGVTTLSQAHSAIKLGDTESVYVLPNGQSVFKQTWVKDVQLTGDLEWSNYTNYTQDGFHNISTSGVLSPSGYVPCILSKYDGTPYSSSSNSLSLLLTAVANSVAMYITFTALKLSVSETGWISGISPSSADIKAYFYGWKMCASDGSTYVSGTKYWKKITDGTGITSTLPTASYAGYTPYTLHYKLATPVYHYSYVNNDITQPILSGFLNIPIGQCQVEQSTGINWANKASYANLHTSTVPLTSVDNLTTTRDKTYVYNGIEQSITYYKANSKGELSSYTKAISDTKYATKANPVFSGSMLLAVPTTALPDTSIGNNQCNLWMNGDTLTFRIRKSDGTLITKIL